MQSYNLHIVSSLRLLLLLLVCFCANFPQIFAQPYDNTFENYKLNFIDYGHNTILMPSDSTAMDSFYGALNNILLNKKQKVHILHIGDSHVQADLLTSRLRSNFQHENAYRNGGRGFIFPYTLARTNNPSGYKVSYTGNWSGCRNTARHKACQWGVAGVVATTYDPDASFGIRLTEADANKYPVTSIKVFYEVENDSSFDLHMKDIDDKLVTERINKQEGYKEFILQTPVYKVNFAVRRYDTIQNHFTLQGITLENSAPGVVYSSVGVNGAAVVSFLRSPAFSKHIAALKPDLVVVSLGTNDAYGKNFDSTNFRINMGRLLQRIKIAAPQASVLLTSPGDCFYRNRPNPNNSIATNQIKRIAEETGVAVWDFYKVMGGFASSARWHKNGYAQADKVHLTTRGYYLQGDLMFVALNQGFLAYMLKPKKSDTSVRMR